jgi:hypothetical protein
MRPHMVADEGTHIFRIRDEATSGKYAPNHELPEFDGKKPAYSTNHEHLKSARVAAFSYSARTCRCTIGIVVRSEHTVSILMQDRCDPDTSPESM